MLRWRWSLPVMDIHFVHTLHRPRQHWWTFYTPWCVGLFGCLLVFSPSRCMKHLPCILQETGDSARIKRSLFYYIMSRKCLIKMRQEPEREVCAEKVDTFSRVFYFVSAKGTKKKQSKFFLPFSHRVINEHFMARMGIALCMMLHEIWFEGNRYIQWVGFRRKAALDISMCSRTVFCILVDKLLAVIPCEHNSPSKFHNWRTVLGN